MNKSIHRKFSKTSNIPIYLNEYTQQCIAGGCWQEIVAEEISHPEADFYHYWRKNPCCWCPCFPMDDLKVGNWLLKRSVKSCSKLLGENLKTFYRE